MAKARKRRTPKKAAAEAKEANDKKSPSRKEEKPPPNPQPVSSSSESENEGMVEDVKTTPTVEADEPTPTKGFSRLFSPYRTLGIVSHGPFHLLPNQNSSNAVVCAAIGERFHMLQCDRLHPVLVSHAVPAGEGDTTGGPQQISHIVSDNSLSVSLVAHGPKAAPRHVTLFQRTQPIGTLPVCPSKEWTIVDVLNLGKIKLTMTGEKNGKKENAALCAVVLSKGKPLPDDGVPVVGDDDDDSDSSDDSESDDDSDSGDQCRGQVVLVVASRSSLTLHKRIELSDFATFCPRVAVHPPTYVNKIVIGGSCSKTSKDAMILLNVKSGKMIHTFNCLPQDEHAKSEITSLESSPAIDTIAVGTSKGMVHLINTRLDRLLFSLRHASKDGKPTRITSMSFRTDGSALQYGIAPMAVGRADGTITIWDLTPGDDEEETPLGRTLLCEMEQVHYPGGVHKLQYMPQEPLLLSTGTNSNSMLMHIFDSPDHSGRILRQRKGHTSSPKHIRYLHPGAGAGGGVLVNSADGTDASACQILSSGSTDRTLRIFSTVRSVLDKEFSQGRGLEKRARELGMKSKAELLLPPLQALVTSEARSRDWGDLVTIHRDHAFAYVWSSKRGAQSGPILRQDGWNVSAMKNPPPATAHATSVALSTCGNFALVGTQGGTIYKYNIQSGNSRGSFPLSNDKKGDNGRKEAGDIRRTFRALEKKMKVSNRASNQDKQDQDRVENAKREQLRVAKLKLASHTGSAVTGIAVDGVNKTVISVGADAKLILWNFKTHAPHRKSPYQLPAAATKLCHVRDSDLAAIALEDYSALLFDCSSLTIVRRFGFGNKATCHGGPISDLGFSPDGRTLYTSSLDGTVRVWDVPTNSCVDWLGFSSPPTSLTISPTGEFLATTHTGKLGISLWSDRSFYQTVHVDGAQALEVPASMDDPAPIAEVEAGEDDHDNAIKRILAPSRAKGSEEEAEDDQTPTGPATAKEKGLITLSGLPPAHWKNLFHLELVKQRNKPKEPPKKPPTAPFFLQWRQGETIGGEPRKTIETAEKENQSDGEWDAVWSDDDEEEQGDVVPGNPPLEAAVKRERDTEDVDQSHPKKQKVTHYRSHLAALLDECASKKAKDESRFWAVTEHIATLGPSAIDVSLSTLCSGMHDLDEGLPLLILACRWLMEACQSRERFEAVNAYLHRFLYLHSGILAGIDDVPKRKEDEEEEITPESQEQQERQSRQREELLRCIDTLRGAQRTSSEALESKMQNTLCLLRHFSRMV
jgi:U3 small nucleolar RNA-associated protein 21